MAVCSPILLVAAGMPAGIVSAPTLSIDNGRIQATTWGEGHAGSLDVQVGRLMLTGGAQIDSSTRGAGHGGEVTVAAREAITISGQSRLDGAGCTVHAFVAAKRAGWPSPHRC